MPLRPETFCLSLARPARELVPLGQVVCLVTTEARFTEEVQANLKFSMTRRGEDGQREKVALLQVGLGCCRTIVQGVSRHWTPGNLAKSQPFIKSHTLTFFCNSTTRPGT